MSDQVTVDVCLRGGICDVVLVGDVDIASSAAAWQVLKPYLEQLGGVLMIDLHQVTFMDSRGIALIARVQEDLGDRVGLELVDPPSAVRRALEVVGLDRYIRDRSAGVTSHLDAPGRSSNGATAGTATARGGRAPSESLFG
jgi:anti-anti-sigma factor